MRHVMVAAGALALAGCIGPFVPVAKVEDTTATELRSTVRAFRANETPRGARALGPMTATSCMNKIWDKSASDEDATNQLLLYSRSMGGNAVGNVTCEPPAGTSLVTNCWQSITCRGTALVLPDR